MRNHEQIETGPTVQEYLDTTLGRFFAHASDGQETSPDLTIQATIADLIRGAHRQGLIFAYIRQ